MRSVVAVAGINGHAWGSWKSTDDNGLMWLRDFFRRDLKNYRTMTYGYDCNIYTADVFNTNLFELGAGLLGALMNARKTESVRLVTGHTPSFHLVSDYSC